MSPFRKLDKNKGGYFGETIDIKAVLQDIEVAAEKNGWSREIFYQKENFDFLGLRRKGSEKGPKIYVSTGIHGDEPAGPLSMLRLIEEDKWHPDLNIWLCPCLNPLGFTLNTRENEKGIDLNRDYRNLETPEVKAHVKWLTMQPDFDLSLCLHEDWESKGFYVYVQRKEECTIAEAVIKEVNRIFPIDLSTKIDGFVSEDGLITSSINIDECLEWREAFYLIRKKKGCHYTFEAGSDFPLEARVGALVKGVRKALEEFCGR